MVAPTCPILLVLECSAASRDQGRGWALLIHPTDKPMHAPRWTAFDRQVSRREFESAMAWPRPAAAVLLVLTFLAAAAAAVSSGAVPWRQNGLSSAAGSDADTSRVDGGMVRVNGTRFVVGGGGNGGRPIYFSGFNAYWLMLVASDPARRGKVVAAFRQAAGHGLNLARTWAFSDGGDTPLQAAPGVYDEAMFQGLDFVVAEARRHGIYLLLCLTNNFHDFGGKRRYVQWARDAGHRLATDDDFFNSTVVKGYYKNHVKTVLTRVNTLTGVAYKDDPTILGWELMNEPRCDVEPTGALVQAWVEEMAPYVKSLDGGHLVTAGLEGFYGLGAHESKAPNPWGIYYGTNFVDTHRADGVDFATIHLYPDVWLWGSAADAQLAFFRNWTRAHIRDTNRYLRMPLLVTEYGKFLWEGVAGANKTQRASFLRRVLDSIYASAARGGPLVGGAFWQLLDGGMDTLRDGYEIILPEDRLAAAIIGNHSRQLAQLSLVSAGEDVELRRRRSAHGRIHVGRVDVGGPGGSDRHHTQTQQSLHILLVRFMSLFTSVSSLFSSV